MGKKRNAYRILDHWEDKDVGGSTILKWILEGWDGVVWIALIWLRKGTTGGLL
jgi:hypothetical protein